MARMKPVPKAVLIIATVAAIGYGLNMVLSKSGSSAAITIPQTSSVQPQEAVSIQPPQPQPETVVTQPQAQPEPQATQPEMNAGLNKLLQAGKR